MRMKPGLKPFLALAYLLSASTLSEGCRSSKPPAIDIGTGDGVGGGDFKLIPGSPLLAKCQYEEVNGKKGYYCPPSALENIWMTTQESMVRFAAWCYDTDVETASAALNARRKSIPGPGR